MLGTMSFKKVTERNSTLNILMRLCLHLSRIANNFTSISLISRADQKASGTVISTAKYVFHEIEEFLWNMAILLKC